MWPGLKHRSKQFAVVLALMVAAYLLLPLLAGLFGLAVGFSVLVVQIIGYVILFVGIPFFLWIMAEALYRVFLRPSVRARRIHNIRNRRLLREAVARNHTASK